MTTGGRGMTPERARAAAAAGLQSVSVSIDGNEATHDRLRGVAGSYRAALDAAANLRAAGVRVSVNTQINKLSMAELPEVLETVIAIGGHAWQIQLTVAMGRAADEPEVLLQPEDLLELFPAARAPQARGATRPRVVLWPGNNIGYFGPYESVLRAAHAARATCRRAAPAAPRSASKPTAPSRDARRCRRCRGRAATSATPRCRTSGSAPRRCRYMRDRTVDDLWGYCRTCYYADVCRAGCTWTGFSLFGKPGNNPLCHHRALEMRRQGKRERLVQVAPAPGVPFDNGRFEIVVEDVT